MASDITIELSRAEALVLFEYLARTSASETPAVQHPAEEIVLDRIEGQLERTLVEPLRADYHELLASARAEVAA